MGAERRRRADLLIGIGNRLRGDDGAGALLVEQLASDLRGRGRQRANWTVVQQLMPELALSVAECERVLFVDACVAPVTREPWIEALPPWDRPAPLPDNGALAGHLLEPAGLVAMARLLYGWRGEAALLRVPACAFPHGIELSTPLRRALPRARRLVRGWLREG